MDDRDRRDLRMILDYYRFRAWVAGVTIGAVGLVWIVRMGWEIIRWAIPGAAPQ